MKNEIVLYTVSDSIGETSQKLIAAVTAQFPQVNFNNTYRFPFVKSQAELNEILQDALKDKAIVVSTLVNQELAQNAADFARRTALQYIDLMNPFIQMISEKTGEKPLEEAGVVHKLNADYFKKIAAIEFAVKYDDGKDPRGFLDADVVLLGVSRTSKTPLSMYLANKAIKVANLPLIPEVPLPEQLSTMDSKKIIGLVCSPENLQKVRNNRLHSLGLNQLSSYTDLQRIKLELDYAYQTFHQLKAHVIDVTDRSIEESALLIQDYLAK